MTEEFVSYSEAVALKECGFDWKCYTFWSKEVCTDGTPTKIRRTKTKPKVCVMSECNSMLDKIGSDLITAPTQALAQKWLREVHKISIEPICNIVAHWNVNVCTICVCGEVLWSKIGLDTYEAALSAGITQALELIKPK